jgi:hypothetical protein
MSPFVSGIGFFLRSSENIEKCSGLQKYPLSCGEGNLKIVASKMDKGYCLRLNGQALIKCWKTSWG